VTFLTTSLLHHRPYTSSHIVVEGDRGVKIVRNAPIRTLQEGGDVKLQATMADVRLVKAAAAQM
jgi:hypothetical protein